MRRMFVVLVSLTVAVSGLPQVGLSTTKPITAVVAPSPDPEPPAETPPAVVELPFPAPIVDPSIPDPEPNGEAGLSGWTEGIYVQPVDVAGGRFAPGSSPIKIDFEAGTFPEDVTVTADVFGRGKARSLSPFGGAIELKFDGGTGKHPPQKPYGVTLDLSNVSLAGLQGQTDRLRLVWMAGCVTEIVESKDFGSVPRLHCKHRRVLPLSFDSVTRLATALVDERADRGDAGLPSAVSSVEEAPAGAPDDGSSIIALGSMSSGNQGTFGATPLTSLSTYQVGLFTGAAELSYVVPLAAPAAGPDPSVIFNYSSASADAMTLNRNNQPGPVGTGWSFDVGSVSRMNRPCTDTGDVQGRGLCRSPNEYVLSLNGVSGRLVESSTNNLFYLQNDRRWKVERKTTSGTGHPGHIEEYWVVTTPDGTTYRFGKEIDDEDARDHNSVQYAAYWDSSASWCGDLTDDVCNLTWRWDLDRVEDTNNNVVSYLYERETNNFDPNGVLGNWSYIRAAHLASIEYTRHDEGSTITQANARVFFNWESRCGTEIYPVCDWPTDFPDTPGDLDCNSTGSCSNEQTFWSQLRLGSVLTQVYDTTVSGDIQWVTTGYFDLVQGFATPPADPEGDPDSSEQKGVLYRIHRRPGGAFEHAAFETIEAENFDANSGAISVYQTEEVGGGKAVEDINQGNSLTFRDVWFGGGSVTTGHANRAQVRVNSNAATAAFTLEFYKDTDVTPFETVSVPQGVGWWSITDPDTFATFGGIHDLTIKATAPAGSGTLKLNWIRFQAAEFDDIRALPSVNYWADGDWAWKRNRDDSGGGNGVSPMLVPRIHSVRNELGGKVSFTFAQQPGCSQPYPGWNTSPHLHCFPAWLDLEGTEDDGYGIFRKYVVTEMKVFDTAYPYVPGNPNVGNRDRRFTYDYNTSADWHLAKTHGYTYDDLNETHSDFRGHKKVTVTEYDTSTSPDTEIGVTEHRFFQGMDQDVGRSFSVSQSDGNSYTDHNWLAGRPLEMINYSATGPTKLRREEWEYGCSSSTSCRLTAGSGIYAAYFVSPSKHDVFAFTTAGTADGTLTETFTYDCPSATACYPRATSEVSTGSGGSSRNIERIFLHNTTDWIVDKSRWVRLRAGTTTAGALLGETEYRYDADTTGGVPPTQGRVNRLRQTQESGVVLETDYDYDSSGRVDSTTDPRGYTSTSSYHPVHGYVESVTNTLTHTTDFGYDVFARQVSVTDLNDSVTSAGYDDYNRVVSVTLPTEQSTGEPTLLFTYNVSSSSYPVSVTTDQLVNSSGSGTYMPTRQFFDGFGRPLQSQSLYKLADGSTKRRVTASRYDPRGLLYEQSSPFEASTDSSLSFVNPAWNTVANYQRFTYDDLGQPDETATRALGSELFSADQTVSGRSNTVVDPDSRKAIRRVDMFGSLVQVEEYEGSTLKATTAYTYDGADRLKSVTDNSGNQTSINYDLMGWKKDMTDPDTGTWNYLYDGNGNLAQQTDARGQIVFFDYDALNRLTRKQRDSDTGGPTLAEWTYDPTTERLTSSKAYGTATVETAFNVYDAKNRVKEKQWTIDGPGGGTFKMAWTYSPADQVLTERYPADAKGTLGETLTRSYDQATGEATTLAGTTTYVAATTYNAAGQLLTMTHGAGGNTTNRLWGYESDTFRLNDIKAGVGASQTDIINFDVYYDNSGNVTSLKDWRNSGQKACFTYDWATHLKDAFTGNDTCTAVDTTTGAAPYDHLYDIDRIGNISDVAYQYPAGGTLDYGYGSKPHAVTSVGSDIFSYDASGNMIKRTVGGVTTDLIYDEFNRMVATDPYSASSNIDETNYAYDADGVRVARIGPEGTVVFAADGLIESRPGSNQLTSTHDPSFETGGLWATAATTGYEGSTAIVRRTTSQASPRSGQYGQAVTTNAHGFLSSAQFNVTAGSTYDAKAWIRGEVDEQASVGTAWIVRVRWYNSAGTTEILPYVNTASGSTLSTTWTQQGGPATAPTGAGKARVELWFYQATGWAAFDDVTFKLGAGANLVPNPGFETTGSWTTGETAGYEGPTNIVRGGTNPTVAPKTGSFAYSISSGADAYLKSRQFNVTAGSGYVVSAGIRGEIDGRASTGTNWEVRVRWYKADGTTSTGVSTVANGGATLTETWTTPSATVTAPSQTAKGQVELVAQGVGWVGFDDVSAKKTGTSTELVVDPGFETGSDGSGNTWTPVETVGFEGPSSPVRRTSSEAAPKSGSWGYAIASTAHGHVTSPAIPVTAGTTYDVASWVRGAVPSDASLSPTWLIKVAWYNGPTLLSDVTAASGSTLRPWWWIRGGQVTAPAGATNAKVDLWFYQGVGWVGFDDVTLTKTADNQLTSHYRHGGQLIAQRDQAGVQWMFSDHLGSLAAEYTSGGSIKRQRYYPFGKVRTTDTPTTDMGYTGQRLDVSGLMFYQSRYYDPAIGRFTQPDTIIPNPENPQDLNRYSYVLNNPVTLSDPTGHCGKANSNQLTDLFCGWGDWWRDFSESIFGHEEQVRDAVSLVTDIAPGAGAVKSFNELSSGVDPFTGKAVPWYLAAAGLVPFGKLVGRFEVDEVADLGRQLVRASGSDVIWESGTGLKITGERFHHAYSRHAGEIFGPNKEEVSKFGPEFLSMITQVSRSQLTRGSISNGDDVTDYLGRVRGVWYLARYWRGGDKEGLLQTFVRATASQVTAVLRASGRIPSNAL